jgi:hypothetical protein
MCPVRSVTYVSGRSAKIPYKSPISRVLPTHGPTRQGSLAALDRAPCCPGASAYGRASLIVFASLAIIACVVIATLWPAQCSTGRRASIGYSMLLAGCE